MQILHNSSFIFFILKLNLNVKSITKPKLPYYLVFLSYEYVPQTFFVAIGNKAFFKFLKLILQESSFNLERLLTFRV